MNFINTITLKNFKSFKDQKIEGCRKINVFIGYPNVGKSNIIEALSLFSLDEENLNFGDFVRIEKLTTLFHNGDISNQAEVRINERNRFVARFENGSVLLKEQFERENTSFEKEDSNMYFLADNNDLSQGKSFRVYEGKNEVADFMGGRVDKGGRLPMIRKYEFTKKIAYSTKGYHNLSYPFGNNIFNIISANGILQKDVESLFTSYNLELLYDTREQKFTILKRTSLGIFSIPYDLIADTLRRVIFYKAAIFSNKEAVLLFEEPEAHMFPPYIRRFTADVIFDKSNQFFISTHSPYVIGEFIEELRGDLAIYVVDYVNGESTVKRLTDDEVNEVAQYGIDLFFNLESYLSKYGQSRSA